MKIFRVVRDNFDCDNNSYYFVNNDSVMKIYQGLNCDLMFTINLFNNIEKPSFLVKQDEYPLVCELITKMLNDIEKLKYLRNSNIISPEYKELYEKGYFSWKSDAPSNEEDWKNKNGFIYNYFNILKTEEGYQLEFINNIKKCNFSVEVNTDRSRYGMIRFEVFKFFKNLENVINQVSSYEDIRQLIKKNTR